MTWFNYLGIFASIAALWESYPEGGMEGDYCKIGSDFYGWNKYTRQWQTIEEPDGTPEEEELEPAETPQEETPQTEEEEDQDVNYLGEYSTLEAAWAAIPEGGQDGDYITINDVRYGWSNVQRNWAVSTATVTPLSSPSAVVSSNQSDINYLGAFASIEDVWVFYPEGGREGDYIYIVENETIYSWDVLNREWSVNNNPSITVTFLLETPTTSVRINYLGDFDSVEDAWIVYPEGGYEGDYIHVDEDILLWNKYSRNWGDTADPSTPAIVSQTVYGDLRVMHNLHVSGAIYADTIILENAPFYTKGEMQEILDNYALASSLLQTVTIGEDEYQVEGTNVSLPAYPTLQDLGGVSRAEISDFVTMSQLREAIREAISEIDTQITFFELMEDGSLHVKNQRDLWSDASITAGGQRGGGGGGGGGTDLLEVWTSLQNNNEDREYDTWKIHTAHFPTLVASGGLSASYTEPAGTGSTLATGISLGIASGYTLPTTPAWEALVTSSETIAEAIISLQSQVDAVASRNCFDNLNVTGLFADQLATSYIYTEHISVVGRRINFGDDGHYIELRNIGTDEEIKWAFHFSDGLCSDEFVIANGEEPSGGGGGGGTDLLEVWTSLQSSDGDYGRWKINTCHFPALSVSGGLTASYGTITGSGDTMETSLAIGVSSGRSIPTDSQITGWNAKQDAITDLSTIRENASNGNAAYEALDVVSKALQSLQSQVDAVASKDLFDELTATSIFSDVATVVSLYADQVETRRIILADGVYIEYDESTQGVNIVGAGLWTQSYVDAGGQGSSSGGGGGTDLLGVWTSLQANDGDFGTWKINTSHFPTLSAGDGLAASYGAVSGSGGTMNTSLVIGVVSGRVIPTTTEETKWNEAYDSLSTISISLKSLQTQVDAVATKDCFDELTASAIYGDHLAASSITAEKLSVEEVIDGTTEAAQKLTVVSKSLWGQTYWTSGGVPQDVSSAPNLYIGSSKVQTSTATQDLAGIGSITAAGALTLTTTKKIYFGDLNHFIELDANECFRFSHGLSSESFVVANGTSSSGGGGTGIDAQAMWSSLQNKNEDTTDYNEWKIATAHFPTLSPGPGLTASYSENSGSGSTLTTVLSIGVDANYKLPTQSEWANVSDNLSGLQSLQAQIDAVSARNNYDEITATAMFADILSAERVYASSIELDGYSLKSIPNAYLANSAITINGTSVSLGGTRTITLAQVIGSSTIGSASVPVWYNGSSLTGCTASSLFSSLSSSAGTNLSVTIAGQNRTATLYATYDSSGENISDKFSIISTALRALQSQIDSVATRSVFDELLAVDIAADTIAATSIYGVLHGNADTATYATSASSATYDSASENIASNFTTIGKLLKSLQAQIDSVASHVGHDETYATIGYFDTLAVSGGIFAGSVTSGGYVTAGAASDRRLKTNVKSLEASKAKFIIMSLNPVTFSWNKTATSLCDQYQGDDLGLIAQEVEPYLPSAIGTIYDVYKRLDYTKAISPLVRVAQDHETRLQAIERILSNQS